MTRRIICTVLALVLCFSLAISVSAEAKAIDDIQKNILSIVKNEDPRSFMVVTSANEIYGEGYKNIFSEKI